MRDYTPAKTTTDEASRRFGAVPSLARAGPPDHSDR